MTDFNKFLKPGEYHGGLRIDDRERQFIIETPTGATQDEPRPIVFFFHGTGGTAEQASAIYGWKEKAKTERFFMVFPQALALKPGSPSSFRLNPAMWRDVRSGSSDPVDDVQFFSTLLGKLETVLPIDRRRVFVTGFSNGAAMAAALGAQFSDRIAAIAPVSGPGSVTADHLACPLPVYYLASTADPLVPFAGRNHAASVGAPRIPSRRCSRSSIGGRSSMAAPPRRKASATRMASGCFATDRVVATPRCFSPSLRATAITGP